MASRLIIVPNTISTRRGDDGRPVEIHTPDFEALGAKPERFEVKTDYRDVSKVLVHGSAKDVEAMATRSREHFTRLWHLVPPDSEP